MPALRRSDALMRQPRPHFAPKIYYFHPLLAGPIEDWSDHLRRVGAMGFDTVLSAPLFAPDDAGDLFLTADHERPHPSLSATLALDDLVSDFAQICKRNGLQLFLDIVLGRVAIDSSIARSAPTWFHPVAPTGRGIDPRSTLRGGDAAYGRFDEPTVAKELAGWWAERLIRVARAGVTGFGCEDPHLVPPEVWRYFIALVRQKIPECRFLAWTPGLDWLDIASLRGVGFDAAFSSVAWWDGRASWFVEEHELLRGFGSVIGCPEAPFGPRLARRSANSGGHGGTHRHMLLRAAATGDGLMIPMGFGFAADRDMDRRGGKPSELIKPPCSSALADDIKEVNALADRLATFALGGEMRALTNSDDAVTALVRSRTPDIRQTPDAIVVLINPDQQQARSLPFALRPLPPSAGADFIACDVVYGMRAADSALDGGEIRVLHAQRSGAMHVPPEKIRPTKLAAAPRIVIDNITPAVDGGRFAAKRIIGESVQVEADVFTDGHELLAVDLMWRAVDDQDWQNLPMKPLANDRWQATILPDRIGTYEFTIMAWRDKFGTFCRDLDLKRSAGADIRVEIAEGREILEKAQRHLHDGEGHVVASALNWLDDAPTETRVDILLCPDLREVMRDAEQRFRYRHEPVFLLHIERPQAAFGSWYELFPRSATDNPERHGTFGDVIGRLPSDTRHGIRCSLSHAYSSDRQDQPQRQEQQPPAPHRMMRAALTRSAAARVATTRFTRNSERSTIFDDCGKPPRSTAWNWHSISQFSVRQIIRG